MTKYFDRSRGVRWGMLSLLTLVLVLGAVVPIFMSVQAADVTNGLDVTIIAAPNFVVDSNVESPSTYAPRVATVIGKFCNTGSATLTNVTGNIGEYSSTTPGTYPARTAPMAEHPHLDEGGGSYSFSHLGSTSDASRYIGSLTPGQCSYQYWHFTYPACENVAGSPDEPACTNDPVWGATNDYDDDLWLTFDVWGTSTGSGTTSDNETHTATMRNEISAMANKIEPNGNPGGQWFNTDASTINPGETITTNGILYRLGNVNQGFDNNNDGVPDYNAWLQPFGDPSYDPSCFRLIATTGVLTVTTTSGDVIIPFKDNLYFSDLPPNNTNVVGEIFYKFLALGGACTIPVSPYQEAASGFDNEKFNGDYGTGPAPIQTFAPSVTIDKAGSPAAGAVGSRVDYTIGFENTSTQADAGLVLASGAGGTISLVISDTVPAGMIYIAGTATANNSIPTGNSVSIRYSTNSGATWTDGDLSTNTASTAPNNLVIIQWWLDEPLERAGTGNNSGSVTFAANLPGTAPTPPFIENCAGGSFADAAPFAESCTVTMITGNNTLGDFVWWDANSDGIQDTGETGIDGVTVSLYYDKNGDGELDDGDIFITSQETASGGAYDFTNLADGNFLVVVDEQDTDITDDRLVPTTTTIYAVDLDSGSTDANPVDYDDADFGFGPVLAMSKTLASDSPVYEGQEVVFALSLTNTLTGDGTGQGSACTYTTYGNNYDASYTSITGNGEWVPYTNAFGPSEPDGLFSASEYANVNEDIGITEFAIGGQAGSISGVDTLMILRVVNPGNFRPVAGESLDLDIIDTTTGTSIHSVSYPATMLNTWSGMFTLEEALPAGVVSGMTIADFNGSRYTISLIANGGGGGGGFNAYLELDAAGFRITTDETCGGAEDTVVTVPLTDTYDASKLQLISAEPMHDDAAIGLTSPYANSGVITWTNVGPIYAGQTKTITVTFKALEPSGNITTTTTNYAGVTGAIFANGNPVNDVDDDALITIDPTASIGDTVWNDNGAGGGTANNGVQDGTEAGLPGVTVTLTADRDVTINGVTYTTGSTIMTAVTDDNGEYLFEGLPDAVYTVTVDETSLTGMTPSTGGLSSPAAVTVSGADVTDIAGTSCSTCELDVDFGYIIPNTIYGNIWEDNDGDATQDMGENGFNGVTVYLCAASPCGSGNAVQTTATDSNGDYLFSNMADGTYYVGVETASGPVDAGSGWSNTVDPDAAPGNSETGPMTVAGGNIYGSYDFGYTQTGLSSIGDTIYADWNGDGDQDTDEDGVSGVTVWLYEDSNADGIIDPVDDALIATTTTDASGIYTFSNLPADDYIVVVDESDLPWDYTQTQDPDESAPCTTCDGQSTVTTDGTSSYLDEDFGYQPVGYGSIGDYVWQDDDGDGLQDSSESGIANITVDLYVWEDDGDGIVESGEQGAFIATTTSATDGSYLFDNLPAGDYIVDVDESDTDLPANHVVSSTYDHDDDLTTADINNDPMGVSLAAGEDFLDADFGFAPGGTIGDYVWLDNNGNGEQDAGEQGINSVTVTLYNDVNGNGVYDSGTDTLYGSTTTVTNGGQDGYYAFTNLPAGDYVVVVTDPANYTLTGDPDAYAADGTPYPPYDSSVTYTNLDGQYGTSLLGGRSDLTADFGYLPDGTIGDTLWLDFDADGVLDVGEPGVAGVDVYLDDGSCGPIPGTCALSTTDANGNYIFNSVADATYTVRVDTATLPVGLAQNYDPDQPGTVPCTTCDNAGSVTISGGSTDLTIDFGYVGTNSISGTVWHDDDDDAAIDVGETIRYENVPIYLWDCGADACGGANDDDVYLGTTLTNSSGYYIFDNLPNGSYRVLVNPSVPGLDGLDPTVVASSTTQHDATLSGNTDSTDNDFGFLSALDFGDLPFEYNRTNSNDNGARHIIISNLYLGSAPPDDDSDGQESADAGRQNIADNGDDYDADGNDDDGVTRQAGLGGAINGGGWTNGLVSDDQGGHLQIIIGGTWSGIPQVFVDFDGNDTTYTLSEVTLLDEFGNLLAMPLAPGTHQVYFNIPLGTFDGVTQTTPIFIRVRLSSTGGLGATGLASNGEVEDYQSDFGPNAITLADFSAQSLDMRWVASLAGLLLLGAGVIFLQIRKQKVAIRSDQ